MPEFDQFRKTSRQIIDEWLTREGRSCSPSDDPEYSLIVDGKYAKLLSSPDPLNSGDLQWSYGYGKASTKNDQPHVVFFVGNVADPEYAEIFEVPSTAFEHGNGLPESQFHWERCCFGNPDQFRQANTVDSPMDAIFRSTPPGHWGVRSDPQLWAELHSQFKRTAVPSSVDEFRARLESLVQQITGENFEAEDLVFVTRYFEASEQTGTSGFVSFNFWREVAIPLLCARFKNQIGNAQNR